MSFGLNIDEPGYAVCSEGETKRHEHRMCVIIILIRLLVSAVGISGVQCEVRHIIAERYSAVANIQGESGLHIPARHPGIPASARSGRQDESRIDKYVQTRVA